MKPALSMSRLEDCYVAAQPSPVPCESLPLCDSHWRPRPLQKACKRLHERRQIFISKIRADLIFQACISFSRFFRKWNSRKSSQLPISFYQRVSRSWGVSDKSGTLLCLPCAHKTVIAHMVSSLLRALPPPCAPCAFAPPPPVLPALPAQRMWQNSWFALQCVPLRTSACYYEARNDYTNNSETILLSNRCVCV